MNIENEMLEKALELLNKRQSTDNGVPDEDECVAVIRIDSGKYLSSVWVDANIDTATLCAETGAICEAHKLKAKITHSLCIWRENSTSSFEVLSPCGICQERLRFFGKDVKVAISSEEGKVIFKSLEELQPYYWNIHK